MTIELILADPHPVMLEGLERVFHEASGFVIRSMVNDGQAAWQDVQRLQPHVIVHELELAGKDGPSLIRAIREHGLPTLPVVFTAAMGPAFTQAHAMGARGLVTKCQPGQTLVDCVRTVMAGHTWLSPMSAPQPSAAQASSGMDWHALLTARERIVARLVIEGLSNKRIASRLNITEGTTKLHLHHIYQKLQCSGRMALMVLMRDSELH